MSRVLLIVALVLALESAGGAVILRAADVGLCGSKQGEDEPFKKWVTLSTLPAPMRARVNELRRLGVAVSFIDARSEDRKETPIASLPAGDLREVLPKLLQDSGAYECSIIGGRLVVLPVSSKHRQVVTGPDLPPLPRVQAVWKYTEWLNANIPAFALFGSQAIQGYPFAPLYVEKIQLTKTRPVVEHLVQLLGVDLNLVFTVDKSCPDSTCQGDRVLFNKVSDEAFR